jgi:hypothetical protein
MCDSQSCCRSQVLLYPSQRYQSMANSQATHQHSCAEHHARYYLAATFEMSGDPAGSAAVRYLVQTLLLALVLKQLFHQYLVRQRQNLQYTADTHTYNQCERFHNLCFLQHGSTHTFVLHPFYLQAKAPAHKHILIRLVKARIAARYQPRTCIADPPVDCVHQGIVCGSRR